MSDNNKQSLLERISKVEFKIEEIDKILEELKPLTTKQATLQVQYNHILDKLDGIEKTISDINKRPAKFWDFSITAIISAIIGFFISKVLGM